MSSWVPSSALCWRRTHPCSLAELRALLVCGMAASLLLLAGRAHAQAPACASDPWVELAFEGDLWSSALQINTREDLRVGLRLRGIQLCSAGPETAALQPVARVILHLLDFERMVVSIEIQDAVTDKQVFRSIDMHAIAADARALSLAQSIDELLRASWVEITIRPPTPSAPPPPAAIVRVFESPSSERLQVLGARFASEHYTGGITLLGADAFVAFWVAPRLALSFALGLRSGLRIEAPHGSIGVSALTANASIEVPLWPRGSRYNLLVSASGNVSELTVTGRADATVRAQTRSAFVFGARLGLSGAWRITDVLRLELTVGPGLAVQGIDLTDTQSSVAGTKGVLLHGSLGVGGLF
ncbi:MAG: hypothetical protein ABW321_08990 [Polyangiales bacterium]